MFLKNSSEREIIFECMFSQIRTPKRTAIKKRKFSKNEVRPKIS